LNYPRGLTLAPDGEAGSRRSAVIAALPAWPADVAAMVAGYADEWLLWVADCYNHRLQAYRTSDGGFARQAGSEGRAAGCLREPTDVCYLSRPSRSGGSGSGSGSGGGGGGELWVAD